MKYIFFKRTAAAGIFCLLIGVGCDNPFATREPEPPKQNQSNWIQPISPTYVLINLKNAISEKNSANYLRCLADTSVSPRQFSFVADAVTINSNPGLFQRWGKEEEANYLNQLSSYMPKDSTASVDFDRLKETTFQDSVIFLESYVLNVHYKCESIDCPGSRRGQAEFRFVRTEDETWYIYKWIDYSTGDDLTWSNLKALFGK
jgi:hypothetical protein